MGDAAIAAFEMLTLQTTVFLAPVRADLFGHVGGETFGQIDLRADQVVGLLLVDQVVAEVHLTAVAAEHVRESARAAHVRDVAQRQAHPGQARQRPGLVFGITQ